MSHPCAHPGLRAWCQRWCDARQPGESEASRYEMSIGLMERDRRAGLRQTTLIYEQSVIGSLRGQRSTF